MGIGGAYPESLNQLAVSGLRFLARYQDRQKEVAKLRAEIRACKAVASWWFVASVASGVVAYLKDFFARHVFVLCSG